MVQELTHLPFEEWVAFVFDHPTQGPEWYWDLDAPYWNGPAALTTEYLIRLFEDPGHASSRFSDAQLNQGLWYLISPGLGEHMFCLDDPTVAIEMRVRCVRSCESLFRKLLLPRCSPHLSHRDWVGAAPLNAVCYMWWDIMPVHGGPEPEDRRALHAAALETMAAILRLDSLACQESALHGLGHWRSRFAEQVEGLIDAFIEAHPDAPRELLTYARAARCGCVL
ncbi:MAG TPA: hypothetical protein VHG30_10045 [Microvirga sp.]|nr:hypothetical protein [Microvirga sp.]